jgi:hypothetical protein
MYILMGMLTLIIFLTVYDFPSGPSHRPGR